MQQQGAQGKGTGTQATTSAKRVVTILPDTDTDTSMDTPQQSGTRAESSNRSLGEQYTTSGGRYSTSSGHSVQSDDWDNIEINVPKPRRVQPAVSSKTTLATTNVDP